MGVLDAIAYGIPVITTPVGGVEDVLVNMKDCIITPVGDVEKLAENLRVLMSDENLRTTIVANADKHLAKEFNLLTIHQQLNIIYSELCPN